MPQYNILEILPTRYSNPARAGEELDKAEGDYLREAKSTASTRLLQLRQLRREAVLPRIVEVRHGPV